MDFHISYPTTNHKNYIEQVYKYCKENNLSMLLKGSLCVNRATKYSDIDLIILGEEINKKINDLITVHGKPVMTNFTENPKGIIILVYEDGLCVDLDLRETIDYKELKESKILIDVNENFVVDNKEILRYEVKSSLLPNRPKWYKILRLVHRSIIKHLSNKHESALNLLNEIKESLIDLEIHNLKFKDTFEDDIKIIFHEICNIFRVNANIKHMFQDLLKDLNSVEGNDLRKS